MQTCCTSCDRPQLPVGDNSWHYEMRGSFKIFLLECVGGFYWLLLVEHAYWQGATSAYPGLNMFVGVYLQGYGLS